VTAGARVMRAVPGTPGAAIAIEAARLLAAAGIRVGVVHRDITRPVIAGEETP
jgi:Mrp family chromosome partitioning ATPase